jgi:hypothetical protein
MATVTAPPDGTVTLVSTIWKPGADVITRYSLGGKKGIRKVPSPDVIACCRKPLAVFSTNMLAFGTIAPAASQTAPARSPEVFD